MDQRCFRNGVKRTFTVPSHDEDHPGFCFLSRRRPSGTNDRGPAGSHDRGRTGNSSQFRMTAEELGIPVSVQYSNLLRDAQLLESPNSSIEAETSQLILCPYFWEYQRFSPELGYQDQI